MKVGDLIRVLASHSGAGASVGQLGVIITLGRYRHRVGAHIMLTDGSKVWLETKRLEAVNESR